MSQASRSGLVRLREREIVLPALVIAARNSAVHQETRIVDRQGNAEYSSLWLAVLPTSSHHAPGRSMDEFGRYSAS